MEEQAEAIRRTKQRYLNEQLQINGWSPEELSDYLAEQRNNGLDINAWQLDELIEQIQRFKANKGRALAVSRLLESEEAARAENEPSLSSEPSLRVEVLAESKAANTLNLRVQPGDSRLKRTLSDLYALRTRLQLEFPFSYVPPVRSAANQRLFAQNFFERLADSRFATESETFKAFLDDSAWTGQRSAPAERQLPQQMLQRLFTLFAAQADICQQNAAVYEQFLADCMPDFETGSLEHFAPVARASEALCQANGKLFSQLKHKCFELTAAFERTATVVEEIAQLYAAHSEETSQFGRRTGLVLPPRIDATNAKVQQALQAWTRQLRADKTKAVDRLAGLFHFRKHEYLVFAGLVLAANDAQDEFRRKWSELEERKRTLFASKNVEKWKLQTHMIKEKLSDVTANYALIRPYMLPEETLALLRRFQFYLFLNKHLLFEFIGFLERAQGYTETSLGAFGESVRSGYMHGELWTGFGRSEPVAERRSTLLLQSTV